jgi:hypothetical protein
MTTSAPDGIFTFTGQEATGTNLTMIKLALDQVEAEDGVHKPLIPITSLTSNLKDGYITGNMRFSTDGQNLQGFQNRRFLYHAILVEGYHKYGNEEHYFIPRAALDISGDWDNIQSNRSWNVPFKFAIDKS